MGYTDAARADGLEPIGCDDVCDESRCCHKVALVLGVVEPSTEPFIPEVVFHWYRQDSDGTWSHKIGISPATNLDSLGNPITDPRTAERGIYDIFCGCFCVCKGAVTIQ
jgi:hypothetical protein